MPQLRQDVITGRWVAVATERARRPDSFTQAAKQAVPARDVCPFCPGHESMTPPEVLSYRSSDSKPDGPGWWLRVVPNLYAAFRMEPDGQVTGEMPGWVQRDARGACEVLISTPDHGASTPGLPRKQVEEIVQSYVDRYRFHAQDARLEYVLILYNHGRAAGASLEHPHSQLYAIALVPPAVKEEIAGAERFYKERGDCVFCRALERERQSGSRLVMENEDFTVFCPYAARTPFETWIVPRAHQPSLSQAPDQQKAAFADALQSTLAALQQGLNDPPFNYFIHSAPLKGDYSHLYHWHLELIPKLSIAAGFELGTGMWINVVKPEESAAFLRDRMPVGTSVGG